MDSRSSRWAAPRASAPGLSLGFGFASALLAALLLAPLGGVAAAADTYPARSITFVVAYAPGGVADAIARIIGRELSRDLGQSVVVENRGGAGGNLAARAVSKATADGYTVLVTTTSVAINETLYKNKGYETNDLRPVAIVASTPDVIAVHKSNPAASLADFVKAAKMKGITFGTAGTGSPSFVGAAYFFKIVAKVDATHVPFQGGAPAVNAAVANTIDAIAISLPSVAPQIEHGTLKGLGLAAPARSAALPNVPTYAESGFPDFYSNSWIGFFVPANTPPAVVATLNAAIERGLRAPATAERLRNLGFETMFNSDADAAALFKTETERWGARVRAIGIVID
jgi:tripartite-type tricarboxylate transporter receptor subunit TctC